MSSSGGSAIRTFTSTQKSPCALTTTGSSVRSATWGTSTANRPTDVNRVLGPAADRSRGSSADPDQWAELRVADEAHRDDVPEHQRLHQHVDAVGTQLLGEASYGVRDVAAAAHVDPDQAPVGLVQHRRVGHLHGHRVADPGRDRLRLVGSGGEPTDEVDAVGRQRLCLRGGREPLRVAAAGGQPRPHPRAGVDTAGAELDLRSVCRDPSPRGVPHGSTQRPDRRIGRAVDGDVRESARRVERRAGGDEEQRDVGARGPRLRDGREQRTAVGEPVGDEHDQDGVGLAGLEHACLLYTSDAADE